MKLTVLGGSRGLSKMERSWRLLYCLGFRVQGLGDLLSGLMKVTVWLKEVKYLLSRSDPPSRVQRFRVS